MPKKTKHSRKNQLLRTIQLLLRRLAHVGALVMIVSVIMLPFIPVSGLVANASSELRSWVWPAHKQIKYSKTDPIYSDSNPVPVFDRGVVTVTFDDGWESIYSNGLQLMENYGINSTQYIISGSVGKKMYMTSDQIDAFKRGGHQIASHSVSHLNLTKVDDKTLEQEVVSSRETLEDKFGPIHDMASPLGAFNDHTITNIKRHYRSHRSTQTGLNTRESFDRYNIQVQNITPNTTIEQVENWILEARQQNGWLVLVYHQVDESGDDYSVTPAEFNKQLNAIKKSGLKTATMDEVLRTIK